MQGIVILGRNMRSDFKLRTMENHNVTSGSLGKMLLAIFSHFPTLPFATTTMSVRHRDHHEARCM